MSSFNFATKQELLQKAHVFFLDNEPFYWFHPFPIFSSIIYRKNIQAKKTKTTHLLWTTRGRYFISHWHHFGRCIFFNVRNKLHVFLRHVHCLLQTKACFKTLTGLRTSIVHECFSQVWRAGIPDSKSHSTPAHNANPTSNMEQFWWKSIWLIWHLLKYWQYKLGKIWTHTLPHKW